MTAPLKFSRRMILIDEDEYKRLSTKRDLPGPVSNPQLQTAKEDVNELRSVMLSDAHPDTKAERYGHLVSRYFDDLENIRGVSSQPKPTIRIAPSVTNPPSRIPRPDREMRAERRPKPRRRHQRSPSPQRDPTPIRDASRSKKTKSSRQAYRQVFDPSKWKGLRRRTVERRAVYR